MQELPTIEKLAKVEEERLLKLWEGLGYYNRARNLKKAAQEIMGKYKGKFPEDFCDIVTLPGIGEYTASAIASICFNRPEVKIDGNVLRVYQRLVASYENIDELAVRKKVRAQLMKIVPHNSGDFNQALMELGETICIPNGMPKCNLCPLVSFCKAKKAHTFLEIPVRSLKKEKKIQKYTVLLMTCQKKIALHKRDNQGVLKNLWEFPMLANHVTEKEIKQYLLDCNISVYSLQPSISHTHIFTHLKWEMRSFRVELSECLQGYVWEDLDTIHKEYAIPNAFQPFLKLLSEEGKL